MATNMNLSSDVVKMVKKALKCLKPRIKTAFDDEELRTLLVQTQGFINMRPLVSV